MTLNQGQIFAAGISIVLKATNQALQVPDQRMPIKYLHFVDAGGNTIVPTYEPDGLDAGSGQKLAGAKIVVPSAGSVAALEAQIAALDVRVAALEAELVNATASDTPGTIMRRSAFGVVSVTRLDTQEVRAQADGGTIVIATGIGIPAMQVTNTGAIVKLAFFDYTPVPRAGYDGTGTTDDKVNSLAQAFIGVAGNGLVEAA
jgi:hypothetical protein